MSGRKQLTIDGKPLQDFGVWTNGKNAWNAAEPDVTTISVPGRSGDLVQFNGRYKNISISYDCLMRRDFRHRFDDLRAFLTHQVGYRRIEDEREEEYYRMGRLVGGLSVSDVIWNADAGIFTLNFSFKPQRWLKRGEITETFTGSGAIYNPTFFEALPLIRVYGYGTLTIGGEKIIIDKNALDYIDIDCESQNAFSGSTNCNGLISVEGDTFPTIGSGQISITKTANIAKYEITPRWWTI